MQALQNTSMRQRSPAAAAAAPGRRPCCVLVVAAAAKKGFGAAPKPQQEKRGSGQGAKTGGAAAEGCPCGSGLTYKKCCKPVISGTEAPPDDLTRVVRARFSAIIKKDVSFLLRSTHDEFYRQFYSMEPGRDALRKLQDDLYNTVDYYQYTNLRIESAPVPSAKRPDTEADIDFRVTIEDLRTPMIDEQGNKQRKVSVERATFARDGGPGTEWKLVTSRVVEVPESLARAAEQQAKDMKQSQQQQESGSAGEAAAAGGAGAAA